MVRGSLPLPRGRGLGGETALLRERRWGCEGVIGYLKVSSFLLFFPFVLFLCLGELSKAFYVLTSLLVYVNPTSRK